MEVTPIAFESISNDLVTCNEPCGGRYVQSTVGNIHYGRSMAFRDAVHYCHHPDSPPYGEGDIYGYPSPRICAVYTREENIAASK